MSGLYAYGVQRAEQAQPLDAGMTGLDGAPLSHVDAGGLAVLVSPIAVGEVRRTRRNMLTHLRLLETAMASGPVLPMRFGVIADDAEGLRAVIAPRRSELAALLDRHDGHAEFGLRITFPRDPALAALTAARPDLAARRAALAAEGIRARDALITLGQHVADGLEQRRKAAERTLMAHLKPLAADFVLRAPEDDVEVLRAEFLLPLSQADAFAAAATAAASALDFAPGTVPEMRLVGPVPPYNFVSIHLDRAAAAA